MDCDTYVTRIKNSQFPTLVAAHQAEVRGPPVGRGPQVENRCSTTQRRSRLQHGYCIGGSRRSAQATPGKGLVQGLSMAARAGVEPTTLRLRVIVSTNAPRHGGANGNHTYAETSLAIYLLIKHARDEIASILCWEDEAVGQRPQRCVHNVSLSSRHWVCTLSSRFVSYA